MKCDETCTRRSFLRTTGVVAATAGITLAASGLPKFATPAAAKGYDKWPFKQLDTKEVAQIAYENYMDLFCAATVLKGIFDPLAKSVGGPYKTFPVESMKWAHGGFAGWGTVCGTLAGGSLAIGNIVGDTDTAEAMVNDLMFYYSDTVLPVFKPAKGKWAEIKNTTKADTPVCHISVGRWMAEEGVAFLSNERAERCARVAASVAEKTAEMLNAWAAAGGKYTPVNKPLANVMTNGITSQNNCTDCHGKNVPKPIMAGGKKD
ncbi:MAG: C-GCAxxG-C-C family (seleno)protein [Candidatus Methylomirabilia bacterium]